LIDPGDEAGQEEEREANMGKLDEFRAMDDKPFEQNRRLFDWLCDDDKRAAFYGELKDNGFPILRFKSLADTPANRRASMPDVYLVSGKADVADALRHGSVEPYRQLDSGGRFMLGLDDPEAHADQRQAAARAMRFSATELEPFIEEAIRRASVLPLKWGRFDLPTELAEEAALRYVEVLFGFHESAHRYLRPYMRGAYKRLSAQIIGRHFVAAPALLPQTSPAQTKAIVDGLGGEVLKARFEPLPDIDRENRERRGLAQELTVIRRLELAPPDDSLFIAVVRGLIAGTIGNVQAAVCIAIDDFFAAPDTGVGPWRIDKARQAALERDRPTLKRMVDEAFQRNPPAPFLTRIRRAGDLPYEDPASGLAAVPAGATLLLALGADPTRAHVFGGTDEPPYMHSCVGKHLAEPLVCELVAQVLRLPGLRPALDASTGAPNRLKKEWGVACQSYTLEFQRDRRLNIQPLHLVIPLKEPVADSAERLAALTKGGAFIVEDALDAGKHVHFAWFMLVDNNTKLSMVTTYDGDFDAYVEHFATQVPLFDEQLVYLEGAPEPPVRKNPKAFVEWVRKHNRAPLGGYFYSAYPLVGAAEIDNAFNRGKRSKP
jgi:cytochrome P450